MPPAMNHGGNMDTSITHDGTILASSWEASLVLSLRQYWPLTYQDIKTNHGIIMVPVFAEMDMGAILEPS